MVMANLTFYFGTMEVGKTTKLIQDHYNYSKYLINIVVMKPKIDTKGGKKIITRTNSSVLTDIQVPKSASLLTKKYFDKYKYAQFILVDEAQFLTEEQVCELWFIAHEYNIGVICYGLKSNFKGELFAGSAALFARADEKHELTVNCSCGSVAMFNARRINGKFSSTGKEVVIDGVQDEVEYVPLCSDCFLRLVEKNKYKSFLKK